MKKRLALIWLVLLWSGVLLVPSLRELYVRQIFGSALMRYSVLPRARSSDDFWAQVALQHPRDLNIWLQAAEEYPRSESDDCACGIPWLETKPAVASTAFPGKLNATFEKETARRYDVLISRFSSDARLPLLIARRLRFTIGWIAPDRIAGELDDSDWKIGKHHARETSDKPVNFSRAEISNAIALCRRGQRLAPRNAFFDWTLFQLLLAARRDLEAWRALKNASSKPFWSEYFPDLWQAEIASYQTVFGRALLWQEKGPALNFSRPGYGFDGEAVRIACWESIKAQRRSDHAKALRLMGDMARAAAVLRKTAARWTDAYNGAYMEQRAFDAASFDARGGVMKSSVYPEGMRDWWFQNYARKHRRPDLAHQNAQFRADYKILKTRSAAEYYAGLTSADLVELALWWGAEVLLLLFIFGAALCLLVIEVLARCWPRLRNALKLEERVEVLSRREIVNGTLACCGFDVLGRAAFAALIGAAWGLGFYLLSLPFAEFNKVFAGAIPDARALFEALDFSSETWSSWIYYAYADPTLDNGLRFLAPLAPLVLGVLYSAQRAALRQKKQNGEDEKFQVVPFFKTLCNGTLWRSDVRLNDALQFFDERLLFLGVTISCLRPRKREAARYALRLLRASLLGFICFASTLYLVSLCASSPLRRQAEMRRNLIVEVGEVRAASFK